MNSGISVHHNQQKGYAIQVSEEMGVKRSLDFVVDSDSPITSSPVWLVDGGPGGIRTLDLRRVRAAYGLRSVHTRLDYRPKSLKVSKPDENTPLKLMGSHTSTKKNDSMYPVSFDSAQAVYRLLSTRRLC